MVSIISTTVNMDRIIPMNPAATANALCMCKNDLCPHVIRIFIAGNVKASEFIAVKKEKATWPKKDTASATHTHKDAL